MVNIRKIEIDEATLEKYKGKLRAGKAAEVEAAIFASVTEQAAGVFADLLNDVAQSAEAETIVKQLRAIYHYRIIRKKIVQVTIKGGNTIQVQSWYGLAQKKKRGRPKKGR